MIPHLSPEPREPIEKGMIVEVMIGERSFTFGLVLEVLSHTTKIQSFTDGFERCYQTHFLHRRIITWEPHIVGQLNGS